MQSEESNTLVKLAKAVIEHAPEGGDAFWDIKFSDIEAALSAAEPHPAPSVAVNAIEAVWKYSLVIESSVRRGDGPEQYAGVTEALRLVKEARSALSAQVQDVAGWQLVPKEPTEDMLASVVSRLDVSVFRDMAAKIYRAMLAAAPAKQEGGHD